MELAADFPFAQTESSRHLGTYTPNKKTLGKKVGAECGYR